MSELFTGESVEAAATAAGASSSASTSVDTAAGVLPAEGTATTAQAAPTDATTTTPDPATPKTDEPKGPIPFDVHKTALDNARAKAAAEATAQYAWAQAIPEPHRNTVAQFYTLLDQSPVDAIDLLFQQAAVDPEHSARLRSWIGRTLGGSRAAAKTDAPAPDAMLEPDFEDQATGATFVSFDRQLQREAALERRLTAAFEKKYGPLEQDYRTRQQRDADTKAYAEVKRIANEKASEDYDYMSSKPHFKTYEKAIAEAMGADESLSVERAYMEVVLPKLSQQERSDVVASLQHKATAGGINPANPSTAAQHKPKSFQEAFERLPASAWS